MKCHIFERWDELCIPTSSTLEIFANSSSDQLPVGLITQWQEHCTVMIEVMGWNPVQS